MCMMIHSILCGAMVKQNKKKFEFQAAKTIKSEKLTFRRKHRG